MKDEFPPEQGKSGTPAQWIANELHFATAFAECIATELAEFGLSRQKIEDIMLRSAQRFDAMSGEALHGQWREQAEDAGVLGWFAHAGEQAVSFLTSVAAKHGPVLIDRLAPVVIDALERALSRQLKGEDVQPKLRAKAEVSMGSSGSDHLSKGMQARPSVRLEKGKTPKTKTKRARHRPTPTPAPPP